MIPSFYIRSYSLFINHRYHIVRFTDTACGPTRRRLEKHCCKTGLYVMCNVHTRMYHVRRDNFGTMVKWLRWRTNVISNTENVRYQFKVLLFKTMCIGKPEGNSLHFRLYSQATIKINRLLTTVGVHFPRPSLRIIYVHLSWIYLNVIVTYIVFYNSYCLTVSSHLKSWCQLVSVYH
jgi:hypothetical protein